MSSSMPHVDRKHKVTPQREGPSRDPAQACGQMAEQPDLLALQRAVLNPAQAAPGDILRLQHTPATGSVAPHHRQADRGAAPEIATNRRPTG